MRICDLRKKARINAQWLSLRKYPQPVNPADLEEEALPQLFKSLLAKVDNGIRAAPIAVRLMLRTLRPAQHPTISFVTLAKKRAACA
jgi:hypothetical protein